MLTASRSGAVDAHSAEVMGSLRDVVRTMYPAVLADRGLRGALAGLGARSPVPSSVEATDLDGLSALVEAAVYFVVAEALTNVVKHSGASHVEAGVRRKRDRLVTVVTDDGLGGADGARGTGVVGMCHRVEALDGWLDVTSPVGGPTAVVAELPCES